jgi:hypothetical protein
MLVSATTTTGIQYATGGDPAQIHTVSANMAASLNSMVTSSVADETARNAAYAADIAAGKTGMTCFVRNKVDWCGWTGTEWLYNKPAPILYSMGVGQSPSFVGTTQTQWVSSQFTFQPSRTGWATAGFDCDVLGVGSNWIAAYGMVNVNFVATYDGAINLLFEDSSSPEPRHAKEWTSRVPVMLTKNVSVTFSFDVWSFAASGSWRFNNFVWRITQ